MKNKRKNLFDNLTENDWKEMNEQSMKTLGVSSLTFEQLFGEKTLEKVNILSSPSED